MLLCQTQVRNDNRRANAERKAAGQVIKRGRKAKENMTRDDDGNYIYIEVKLISVESQPHHALAMTTSTKRVIRIRDSDLDSGNIDDVKESSSGLDVELISGTKVLQLQSAEI